MVSPLCNVQQPDAGALVGCWLCNQSSVSPGLCRTHLPWRCCTAGSRRSGQRRRSPPHGLVQPGRTHTHEHKVKDIWNQIFVTTLKQTLKFVHEIYKTQISMTELHLQHGKKFRGRLHDEVMNLVPVRDHVKNCSQLSVRPRSNGGLKCFCGWSRKSPACGGMNEQGWESSATRAILYRTNNIW